MVSIVDIRIRDIIRISEGKSFYMRNIKNNIMLAKNFFQYRKKNRKSYPQRDFVVNYNPTTDTDRDIAKRIFYTLIIKNLKDNKPRICFIGGKSGSGKSETTILLQTLLMEMQDLDIKKHFSTMNVYTPLQYPQKINDLLFNKEHKKVNVITLHEAREVVKAKQWQSFLVQSVADINAMSRSIKPICIFIVSQFIRDITTDIRYTLDFYMTVRRPLRRPARLYVKVLWNDERDLEHPKMRVRRLAGFLRYPDGTMRRYVPAFFELPRPSKELINIFKQEDLESKINIIKSKLNKMLAEMKIEMNEGTDKIDAMVDFYSKQDYSFIGKMNKGKWKLKPQFAKMHDLTPAEAKVFENKFNEKIESGQEYMESLIKKSEGEDDEQ